MQWPRMSVCGLSTAATMRAVICRASMRSLECTLATTTSSCARRSRSKSSEPSSKMSTSMPDRMRNGASCSLSPSSTSSCARRRSSFRPWATVRRALWSVSTRYSRPSARAASAISRIGLPPSDQSECEWQSPRSDSSRSAAGPSSDEIVGDVLEVRQVVRHVAAERLGDDLGRRLAHAVEALEASGIGQSGELLRGQCGDGPRRVAESPHLVGVGTAALQPERDLVERVERIHA